MALLDRIIFYKFKLSLVGNMIVTRCNEYLNIPISWTRKIVQYEYQVNFEIGVLNVNVGK